MDKYKWELVRFGKNADAIQAVATGRAYANLAGDTVMGWTSKKNPLVVPSNLVISSGRVGAMAFHTTSVEMRKKFEKVMECMKADGTIAKIHEKWTGQKPVAGGAAYKVVQELAYQAFPIMMTVRLAAAVVN